MTGGLYLIAGGARLGFIAAFLSQPILTGYLNGIALIILVGQLPNLLGYPSDADECVPQLHELVEHLGLSHPPTALLGASLLGALLILRRVAPGALVAVVGGIVAVAIFDLRALGVAVTGQLPGGLAVPHIDVDYFGDRLHAAIAASRTLVEWVVVDASPINWIDATALQRP